MSAWTLLELLAGLAALLGGGEALQRGASRLALALGVPVLLVGLTVVALGTSAPELAVSAEAALAGEPEVALGNVLGSNVLNLLLVVGLAALLAPLAVPREAVEADLPAVLGASLLAWLLALDGRYARLEGAVLVAAALGYTAWRFGRRREPAEEERPPFRLRDPLLLLAGLGGLVMGAHWVVESAVALATALGASTLLVSLAVVALGTSLPELAVSLLASRENGLAVGNALGSNLYNLLLILGVAALLSPGGMSVPGTALRTDFPVMLAATVFAFLLFRTGGRVSRLEGAALLLAYGGYLALLLLRLGGHEPPALLGRLLLLGTGLALLPAALRFARGLRRGGPR